MLVNDADYAADLAAANALIARGEADRVAGGEERARVLAAEAERRGRGGIRSLAAELGVSAQAIQTAVARGRGLTTTPGRTLPVDTLARGLAAERAELAPQPQRRWQYLAHLVRGIYFDPAWVEGQPGALLADDIEETDDMPADDRAALAAAARGWSRFQALAVIDACQRGDLDALPTVDDGADRSDSNR